MADPKPAKTAAPEMPDLQVEIDDATARGAYANLALLTHSETEFVLDFIFLQPQNPKARVMSRVLTSPVHAKRLLSALADNVRKYEARFGEIKTESGAPPSDKFYH